MSNRQERETRKESTEPFEWPRSARVAGKDAGNSERSQWLSGPKKHNCDDKIAFEDPTNKEQPRAPHGPPFSCGIDASNQYWKGDVADEERQQHVVSSANALTSELSAARLAA